MGARRLGARGGFQFVFEPSTSAHEFGFMARGGSRCNDKRRIEEGGESEGVVETREVFVGDGEVARGEGVGEGGAGDRGEGDGRE